MAIRMHTILWFGCRGRSTKKQVVQASSSLETFSFFVARRISRGVTQLFATLAKSCEFSCNVARRDDSRRSRNRLRPLRVFTTRQFPNCWKKFGNCLVVKTRNGRNRLRLSHRYAVQIYTHYRFSILSVSVQDFPTPLHHQSRDLTYRITWKFRRCTKELPRIKRILI